MTRTQNGPTLLKFHIVKKRRRRIRKKLKSEEGEGDKGNNKVKYDQKSCLWLNRHDLYDWSMSLLLLSYYRCCCSRWLCGCHGWWMVWSLTLALPAARSSPLSSFAVVVLLLRDVRKIHVLLPGGGSGPSCVPSLCHTSGVGKSVSPSLIEWVARCRDAWQLPALLLHRQHRASLSRRLPDMVTESPRN